MASDTFFNPDPTERLSVVSDTFCNTVGPEVTGDAWFDVLNENNQDTSWVILNQNKQDTAWSIFAKVLYYMQKFVVKAICFDYDIAEPISFDKQVADLLDFTFYPTGVITETMQLLGSVSIDTVNIADGVTFGFQIQEPVIFTFGVSTVHHGSSLTENKG